MEATEQILMIQYKEISCVALNKEVLIEVLESNQLISKVRV